MAETVVVMMVRGLVSDLTFLYTMFAAASLSGGLTRLGFRPLVITRDGAENNRKVFALHGVIYNQCLIVALIRMVNTHV